MAITVSGTPSPTNGGISGFGVTENPTPLDPGSTEGGIGQLQWTTMDWPLSRLKIGEGVLLEDESRGRFLATVRDVSGDNGIVTFTADSELAKFNVDRIAKPQIGLLSKAVRYYMDLVGIAAELDFQAPDVSLPLPGFVGNVWDNIKALMSARGLELAMVDDKVVVREPHTMYVELDRHVQRGFSVNTQDAARSVEVTYFNHRQITDGEVFPLVGDDPTIQQVDAKETVIVDIPIDASLTSVNQPVHVYTTGPENKSGTKGVYTVVGNDDLPIKPAQWAAEGGFLKVELPEPSLLRLTIRGSNNSSMAPFRIAMSAGGTDYNSLHITGSGVDMQRETVMLYTGADPNNVSNEIGTTVENQYISTIEQAYTRGQYTAAAYSGLQSTITGTVQDAGFLEGTSATQLLGNVIGARVERDHAMYRITETNVGPDTISYSAVMDTTVADFNKVWKGKTTADFNSVFFNMTSKDFSMLPLWDGTD